MDIGERFYKSASCRIAIPEGFPEDMHDGMREVVAIAATNQRKGHATALLHEVCREADIAGIVLLLRPEPFADGMDAEQLAKWYGRFGFVQIQAEPVVLMARQVQRLNGKRVTRLAVAHG
jgi:GNAT superfamily N-acetyltransferase